MIAFNLILALLAVGGLALVVRLAHSLAAHRDEPAFLVLPRRVEPSHEREAA